MCERRAARAGRSPHVPPRLYNEGAVQKGKSQVERPYLDNTQHVGRLWVQKKHLKQPETHIVTSVWLSQYIITIIIIIIIIIIVIIIIIIINIIIIIIMVMMYAFIYTKCN